jgi:hypothetical protein
MIRWVTHNADWFLPTLLVVAVLLLIAHRLYEGTEHLR